jgi:hypothetical protein
MTSSRDFLQFTLEGALHDDKQEQQLLLATLKAAIPMATWRSGDSDSQGLYISGAFENGIHVKIWMGEAPVYLTISARSVEQANKEGLVIHVQNMLQRTLQTIKYDMKAVSA